MPARVKATFIEPTSLLRTDALPDDPKRLLYELKLDGYRRYESGLQSGAWMKMRVNRGQDCVIAGYTVR